MRSNNSRASLRSTSIDLKYSIISGACSCLSNSSHDIIVGPSSESVPSPELCRAFANKLCALFTMKISLSSCALDGAIYEDSCNHIHHCKDHECYPATKEHTVNPTNLN